MLAVISATKRKSLQRKAAIVWEDALPDVHQVLQDAGTRWRETFTPLMKGVVEDAAQHWQTAAGLSFDVRNLEAEQWFFEHTLQFSTVIQDTSEREIAALLQQGTREGWSVPQMQSTLTDLFQQWTSGNVDAADFAGERLPPYRTEMIARTETMRAANAGSREIYQANGIEQKEWLTSIDGRERESHAEANGQIVGIDEPFIVGGEELMQPGDPSGSPGETINCRCTVLPVLDKAASPVLEPSEWSSLSDARDWMAQRYPDVRFDWKNAGLEPTQKAIGEFDRLMQKYPGVAERIKVLETVERSEVSAEGNLTTAIAYANPKRQSISYFTDYLQAATPESPGYGGWLVTDTTDVEGNIAHEFGHHVQFWLEAQRGQAFTDTVSLSGFGLVDSTAHLWTESNLITQARRLSAYSMTNQRELFAEVFKAHELVPERQWNAVTKRFDVFMDEVADPSRWSTEYRWLDQVPYDERHEVGGALRDQAERMGIKY